MGTRVLALVLEEFTISGLTLVPCLSDLWFHGSLFSVTWSLYSHSKPGVFCLKCEWGWAEDHPLSPFSSSEGPEGKDQPFSEVALLCLPECCDHK